MMCSCGGEGLSCCPPASGWPSYCTAPGTVCQGGGFGPTQCVACGGSGEACCDGQACDGGGCCVDGLCVDEGESCGDDAGLCAGGGCEDGACGRIGEACCDGDIGCSAPFAVCGAGDVCTSCGGEGDPCCGNVCNDPYLCQFMGGGRRACVAPMSTP
jgi:hypothetical protein